MTEKMLKRYNPALEIHQNFKGIIDVSLREGEQFAGVAVPSGEHDVQFKPVEFSLEQASTILGHLHSIGIEYSEVSNPSAPDMADMINRLTQLPNRPKLLAHIRNHPDDIRAAVATGVEGVDILTTVDENRLSAMGQTMSSYLERLHSVIVEADAHGLETRVSVEHAWKSCYEEGGLERMLQVYTLADQMSGQRKADDPRPPNRIGIADTIGVATHQDVEQVISAIAGELKHSEIEVHFHNDTGAATTNAFQALISGANWVDTSLAGYGERNGITPLSCLVTRLYSIDPELVSRYQTQGITPAERYMASIFQQDVPHDLPSSYNGSTHHAGIHVKEIFRNGPGMYELVAPAVIGNERHILNGTFGSRISGRTTDSDREEFFKKHGR